jgi:ParB family transcriptional regulator, chromosome partitioning protein
VDRPPGSTSRIRLTLVTPTLPTGLPTGAGSSFTAALRRAASWPRVEAGCTDVPATIRSVDPETGGLELAMIENLVREELSPVDEAYGYQRLIEPA